MKQLDSVTDQFPLPLLKAQEASTALDAHPQESWHNICTLAYHQNQEEVVVSNTSLGTLWTVRTEACSSFC